MDGFHRAAILLSLAALTPLTAIADAFERPPVMLAEVYHAGEDIDLAGYWVSEKLDGVRAYWDGEKLLTRNGNRIAAPAWFTAGWPKIPLDGELWMGRSQFERTSGTVRAQTPDETAWRQMRYEVFDLPAHPGRFDQRLAELQALLAKLALPQVQAVEQFKLAHADELQHRLDRIVQQGGEGLMLHRGSSLYRAERSDDLLKLKPYDDAEAKVIEHLPGKGKYEGMTGALLVERPDGLRFRVGTGFSDEQRRHPPAVGSVITYAYSGLTEAGVPRFARFLRVRSE